MKSTAESSSEKHRPSIALYVTVLADAVKDITEYFTALVFQRAANLRINEIFVGFRDTRGNIITDLTAGYGTTAEGEPLPS